MGKDFSLSDLLLKLQFVKLFIFAHFPGLLLIEEGREGLLLGSPFDVLLGDLGVWLKGWCEVVRILFIFSFLLDPTCDFYFLIFVLDDLFSSLMDW